CGAGHVWVELIDPDTREPMEIETGAVGELVYTALTREAMPVVRFLGGDIARIEGTTCECGRTSFRQRVLGRRDDMFIVRGVNVYPTAILAVVGDFRPKVTGRARVIRKSDETSIEPPIPVEVEVTEKQESVVVRALVGALVARGRAPSPIAARLTSVGAPVALRAAVAAGLLGMGDGFGGSIEQAARTLQEAPLEGDPRAVARRIVEGH